MIPICRDPKRFVAALNKERARLLFDHALPRKTNAVVSSTIPSFRSFHALTALELSFSNDKYVFREASKLYLSTAVSAKQPAVEHWVSTTGYEPAIKESAVPESMNLRGPRGADWFTGVLPKQCPGFAADGKLYSLPLFTFDSCSKESLHAYFDNSWTLTEVLLGSLQGEETFIRPPYHDLRHPMIFYYGHPAVFYINKLRVAGLMKDPIDPYLESIFEVGVDEMSWDDLSKNKMSWPSVQQVHEYRQKAYSAISSSIKSLTDDQVRSIGPDSPLWALVMAFEHERIHIETSSVLINELPNDCVRFPEGFPSYHPSIPPADKAVLKPIAGVHYPSNEMISVPAQRVVIGKPRSFPSFGWDNEYGQREFEVPAFRAAKFKATNGEFLEFVRDGGYARQDLWSEPGWQWRTFRNVKWPVMWKACGPQGSHQYNLRVLFDTVAMPWDWPVWVNYHEASAFAKWKSEKDGKNYRILTELEHRAIRDNADISVKTNDHAVQFAGNEMVRGAGYNINLAHSSMSPVNANPANKKGFHDVFGNAWEWTEDYFCALPGFRVHPFYEDFSTPCFDGLHHVIQGGSFISTGDEASVHSRFHFRPHFHQHASFRLVEPLGTAETALLTSDTDAPGPFVGSYPFRRSQSEALKQQADVAKLHAAQRENAVLAKHFLPVPHGLAGGSAMEQLAQTLLQMFTKTGKHTSDFHTSRLLEIGCGPGGLSLQLARHFHAVIGMDHSQTHVKFAKDLVQQLKANHNKEQTLTISLKGEGELTFVAKAALPKPLARGLVDFRCADPMCVPAELRDFDVVVINDVLDQLTSPNALLGRLGGLRGLVKPGQGLLAVVSSYQWIQDATPRSLWLGGFMKEDGSSAVLSEEGLVQRLREDFVKVNSLQLPLVWQETQHELKGKILHVTLFARK
eukprot:gene3876-4233_t